MIEIPPALAAALSELAEQWPRRTLTAAVDRLRSAYRADGAPGRALAEIDAAAYAVYRMPATYAAVRSALAAGRAVDPGWYPARVLDLGAGTGATGWALGDAFGPQADRGIVIDAVEREQAMATVGRRLRAPAVEVRWTVRDAMTPARPPAGDDPEPAGRPDLVVLAYALGELAAGDRSAVVAGLGAAPSVLLVEPGTPRGYAAIAAARAELIAAGHAVVAPCPHSDACPIAAPDWCHFAARLPRSAVMRQVKAAELAYEDEKFSYLLTRRGNGPVVPARVVRHPRQHGGHIGLRLCEPSGQLRDVVVSRRDRDAYRRARKLSWGEPWPV